MPPHDEESRTREGELLAGKYFLEKRLGAGGMGEVYRAQNRLIGKTVAIKLVLREHAKNGEIVERFLREARAANMVRHPNVVDVLDIGRDEAGTPFMVQEFLEGEDFGHHLEEFGGRVPVVTALTILVPVVEAVAAAHEAGVVHRDLKPENIFLAREGGRVVPKVLDFGISKVAGRAGDKRMTATGVAIGTPAYMSPEQVQGARNVDARTDVWALGVMLYEVLTGQLPFDGETHGALFLAICTKDPTPLDEVTPGLPRSLWTMVSKCLQRETTARYPNAGALLTDLRTVQQGVSLAPPPIDAPAAGGAPAHARRARSEAATVAAGADAKGAALARIALVKRTESAGNAADSTGPMIRAAIVEETVVGSPGVAVRAGAPPAAAGSTPISQDTSSSAGSAATALAQDPPPATPPALAAAAAAPAPPPTAPAEASSRLPAQGRGGFREIEVAGSSLAPGAAPRAKIDLATPARQGPANHGFAPPPRESFSVRTFFQYALALSLVATAVVLFLRNLDIGGVAVHAKLTNIFAQWPASMLGVAGAGVGIGGIALVVRAFTSTPMSWGLVTSGGGLLALAYVFVTSAVAGTWPTAAGSSALLASLPQFSTVGAAMFCAGLAVYALGRAWDGWQSGTGSARVVAAGAISVALGLVFVTVQIARTTTRARLTAPEGATTDAYQDTGEDGPMRRRAGYGRR